MQSIRTLAKTGLDSWEGTAPATIGTTMGQEKGDTFYRQYTIDLQVPDGTSRVTFDDWTWLPTDDRLLKRAYMKRAGVDVGDVIIAFEKLNWLVKFSLREIIVLAYTTV